MRILVNNLSPGHSGWINHIRGDQYISDIIEFLSDVRDDVESVRIFGTDFRDPTWASFDTRQIADKLCNVQSEGQRDTVYIPTVLYKPPEARTYDDNFELCINFVLKWEGGYANNSLDPGGETHWGISKRSYPDLDIKNLTKQEAIDIYRRDYWEASRANMFPWPLCLVHFNAAVNTGIYRASMFLEQAGRNPYMYIAKQTAWYTTLALWPTFGAAWTRRMAALLATIAYHGDNL